MEISEKSFARQKFRTSRGRGRGGRGGGHRGGQQSGPARQLYTDLDSNAYRYEEDAIKEDGTVAPKSQGADLEALIKDTDVHFNRAASYRFRTQLLLHDGFTEEEAPPLGGTRPEELLAIDLEALAASLSALPLHALLGLEPHYLEGVEMDAGQQRKAKLGSVPVPTVIPPPPLQQQQQTAALSAAGASYQSIPSAPVTAPKAMLVPRALSAAAAPAAVLQPKAGNPPAATAATASAGRAGVLAIAQVGPAANEDDELEALLMAHATSGQQVHPTTSPASTQASATALSRPGIRPVWPAMDPPLAAIMPASRGPVKPFVQSLEPQLPVQPQAAPFGVSHQESGGLRSNVADLSIASAPGLSPGPSATTPAAACSPVAGSEPTSIGRTTLLSNSHHSRLGTTLVPASSGGPAGPVHLAPAGASGPPTRAAPAAAVGPTARVVGAPFSSAAGSGCAVGGHAAGGEPSARDGNATAMPPAAVAAGASVVGGAPEQGVVDDELRLLLGLPAAGGGPLKAGSAATAGQSVSQPRLGLKATRATLPPAAGTPAALQPPPHPLQPAPKSLDDWLNSL